VSDDPEGIAYRRQMTAMWAHVVQRQMGRLIDAVEDFDLATTDAEFRARFATSQQPIHPEWVPVLAEATEQVTPRRVWAVGADRYFLLLALAQLRKCVVKLLPEDDLPHPRDEKMLRILRDVDEHWDKGDDGWSLAELRQSSPHAGPGRFGFDHKRIWIGEVELGELEIWVEAVADKVRALAEADGTPIPTVDEPLTD
jgi:hypothetical protein